MLKRISSIVLTVAMLLSMICTFSVVSADAALPQVALTADDADLKVQRGDTVNLLVSVQNYTPAVAIQISGTHAKDVLLATQVKGSYDVTIAPGVTVPVNYVISNEANSLLQFVPAVKPENNDVAAIWADTVPIPTIGDFCMVVYTVKDDAPLGKTTLEFGFDYYSVGENLDLTPGEDYVAKTTLDLEIVCEHLTAADPYTKPVDGTAMEDAEHSRTCATCGVITSACTFEADTPVAETCTEDGYTPNTCTACGYVVKTDIVNEIDGHEMEWAPVTSGVSGHVSKCVLCGFADESTKADCDNLGGEQTVPPTCITGGQTGATCSVCANMFVSATTDPTGEHVYGAWAHVEGTEGENGKHTRTCVADANCTASETVACTFEKDAAASVAATCTEEGKDVFKCTVCTYSYEVTLDALGHDLTPDAGEGVETHSCSRCDLTNAACDYEEVQAPTCVDDGIDECACGRQVITEADGWHADEDVITIYKAPTATEEGYFSDYCTACGETIYYGDNEDELYIEVEAGEPFADLKSEADGWFYDPAIFCYSYNGIMIGEYDNFNGNGTITRGQVVTVLGRLIFNPLGGDEFINGLTDEEFEEMLAAIDEYYGLEVGELTDLKGEYYDRYALVLAHMGVVMGYDDNTFRGNQNVTREELAAFIVRFLNSGEVILAREIGEPVTYKDMDQVSEWAKEVVAEAGEMGLFIGAYDYFNPQDNATRGELATLLERIIRATEYYPVVDYADFIAE